MTDLRNWSNIPSLRNIKSKCDFQKLAQHSLILRASRDLAQNSLILRANFQKLAQYSLILRANFQKLAQNSLILRATI